MPNRNLELEAAVEAFNVGRQAVYADESKDDKDNPFIIDNDDSPFIIDEVEDEPVIDKETAKALVATDEISQLLAGFAFPATKGVPNILIGKRNRLYLKGAFKGVLGVQPQTRVIIGYNVAEDAFAVVKPEALRHNREAQAAGYFVSLRYDVTAAKMFNEYKLDRYEGQTYYFDKASSDASVAIFRRY